MIKNFGIANDFNVFVLGDHTESNTDSEGKVAVGGDATYINYGIGDKLTQSVTRPDLIVRGNIDISGGINFNGNTVIDPTSKIIKYTMKNNNGVPNQPLVDKPIDFDLTSSYLQCASTDWGKLPANGTAYVEYSSLTLMGTDSNLNVFSVEGTNVEGAGLSLEQLKGINIIAPPNSTILVNVFGKIVGFGGFSIFRNSMQTSSSDAEKILWNLPDAVLIPENTTSIKGSLLAPNATYHSGYSNVEGTIIVANLNGHVEAHNWLFKGDLPVVCESSIAPEEDGDCTIQAKTDIIESIALQQTALAHVLNAEGEKIQKVVSMDLSVYEIINVNDSVTKTVKAITDLESILLQKTKIIGSVCHKT